MCTSQSCWPAKSVPVPAMYCPATGCTACTAGMQRVEERWRPDVDISGVAHSVNSIKEAFGYLQSIPEAEVDAMLVREHPLGLACWAAEHAFWAGQGCEAGRLAVRGARWAGRQMRACMSREAGCGETCIEHNSREGIAYIRFGSRGCFPHQFKAFPGAKAHLVPGAGQLPLIARSEEWQRLPLGARLVAHQTGDSPPCHTCLPTAGSVGAGEVQAAVQPAARGGHLPAGGTHSGQACRARARGAAAAPG